MINQRTLGKTGIDISEIGFGCMSLEKSKDNAERLIHQVHEKGVNFFDTADLYDKGANEEWVGNAVKPFRKQIILATKVGNVWHDDGEGWDWNPTKSHILSAVDESLRRLQTDYIDLYQLHGGTIEDPIDEIIEAFELLKEQGKIRAYGISSIRPNVIREYVKRSNISSVMMQYSLLDRRPEEACLDLLHKNKISVLARGSLAKGLLIDKPAKEYLGYYEEEVETMKKLVNRTSNPVGTAIQFTLNHPAVASAVVGIRTEDQLAEVVDTSDYDLTERTLELMGRVLEPKTYDKHR
jgi:aryl-alcohol dehydrogenase-like predicted oxidoreductase